MKRWRLCVQYTNTDLHGSFWCHLAFAQLWLALRPLCLSSDWELASFLPPSLWHSMCDHLLMWARPNRCPWPTSPPMPGSPHPALTPILSTHPHLEAWKLEHALWGEGRIKTLRRKSFLKAPRFPNLLQACVFLLSLNLWPTSYLIKPILRVLFSVYDIQQHPLHQGYLHVGVWFCSI